LLSVVLLIVGAPLVQLQIIKYFFKIEELLFNKFAHRFHWLAKEVTNWHLIWTNLSLQDKT